MWQSICYFFFFNDTATTEIYTLSLHDALPISRPAHTRCRRAAGVSPAARARGAARRSALDAETRGRRPGGAARGHCRGTGHRVAAGVPVPPGTRHGAPEAGAVRVDRAGGGGLVCLVSHGARVRSARAAVRGFPGREHRPGAGAL